MLVCAHSSHIHTFCQKHQQTPHSWLSCSLLRACLGPGLLCRGANDASKAKAQYNYWNIKVPIIKTALLRGQLISMSSKGEMKRVPGPMLPASTRLHRVSCGLPHPSPMHHEERLIPGVFCPTHRQPKPQTTAERMQG